MLVRTSPLRRPGRIEGAGPARPGPASFLTPTPRFAETLSAAQATLNTVSGLYRLPGTAGTHQAAQSHPVALSAPLRPGQTTHHAKRQRVPCAAVPIGPCSVQYSGSGWRWPEVMKASQAARHFSALARTGSLMASAHYGSNFPTLWENKALEPPA